MKFEDYLMQPKDEKHTLLHLQQEVEKLQSELEEEQAVSKCLHGALYGSVSAHPRLASLLPPQVQRVLAELAMVEEEIMWLERKVDELKLSLYVERKQTKEWKQMIVQHQSKLIRQHHLPHCKPGNRSLLDGDLQQISRSQRYEISKEKWKLRRASLGSAADIISLSSPSSTNRKSRRHAGKMPSEEPPHLYKEIWNDQKPNELSEELIKCLIGVFLDLNQAQDDKDGLPLIVPKLTLSCISSKGSKSSFNCKASLVPSKYNVSNLDPYGIMPDLDSTIRDIGPYKNFIQITRNSIYVDGFSQCLSTDGKLRDLMQNLGNVDLTFMTYKQKLAFWINIFNASIMHAFLEHGLPSSQEKLLAIMKKATVNVGGIVLNALAIEHFILRHPSEPQYSPTDEKEILLRNAYGLGYPEPNVTFALCRGSWSSPALRVYTPDEVINELERAKVDYLEASVGITSKRKIAVPKLLLWHMRDFADDMESLLEWIYSQLPRSGLLKRLMMECLNGETRTLEKLAEIQPYESEFRYLIPL